MLDLSSVVIAILETAASKLTSHLLTRKKEPVDIQSLIDQAVSDLRTRDKELQISMKEIALSLESLKDILVRLPEFKVKGENKIYYRPQRSSELGDVLYRLDEEIESLRGTAESVVQPDKGNSQNEQAKPESADNLPSILRGLDEEIENMRKNSPKSTHPGDEIEL
jgi:hypothetical protein